MLDTKPKIEVLTTVDGVIRALGGTRAIMALTRAKSPQVVNNWRALDRFASHTYLILMSALVERGMSAPATLWGITEPTDSVPRP